MPPVPTASAYNRTRAVYLATELVIANTHWSRFRGLMATGAFPRGSGLWLNPSRGIHTLAMRFPIDALYLDHRCQVIYLAEDLQPWRLAPFKLNAASVLELPSGTIRATQTALADQVDILLAHPIHSEAA